MTEDTRPLMVTIQCITYNHEPYIRQCLEGFVMQKANFRFEAIIHDDASTDGTAAIVREYAEKYPDIIKPIFETENQYSKSGGFESLQKIMDDHTHGKYVAICEGDDYWIDSLKLQKQVDFLEDNPDYGMCYTDFDIQDDIRKEYIKSLFKNNPQKFPKTYTIEEWLSRTGYTAPMTWCMKRDVLLMTPPIYSTDRSFVVFAHFLYICKVYCLNDVTAVYRIAWGSVTHSTSIKQGYNRLEGLHQIQTILIKKYLPKERQSIVLNQVDQCYFSTGLKIFVLLGMYDKVLLAKRFFNGKTTLSQKILLSIPQNKIIEQSARFFYTKYLKSKKLID